MLTNLNDGPAPVRSSIAYSIQQVFPGSDVRVIHRIADSEGQILTRVRSLLWLVTLAALLAAALAVGASSAASVIERRSELALMKALAGSDGRFPSRSRTTLAGLVGGNTRYAIGYILARIVGTKIFGVPPLPSFLVLSVVLALPSRHAPRSALRFAAPRVATRSHPARRMTMANTHATKAVVILRLPDEGSRRPQRQRTNQVSEHQVFGCLHEKRAANRSMFRRILRRLLFANAAASSSFSSHSPPEAAVSPPSSTSSRRRAPP